MRTGPQNSLVFTFSHVHLDFSTGTEARLANRSIARAPLPEPLAALPRGRGMRGAMKSACRHGEVATRDFPVCEGHAVDRTPLRRARPGAPPPASGACTDGPRPAPRTTSRVVVAAGTHLGPGVAALTRCKRTIYVSATWSVPSTRCRRKAAHGESAYRSGERSAGYSLPLIVK